MTMALCLNCGAVKFGAFIPCLECEFNMVDVIAMSQEAKQSARDVLAREDVNLSISFSDHNFEVSTLEQFGQVIKSIKQICPDRELARWSFLKYVSGKYPDILTARFPPYLSTKIFQVLAQVDLPEVELRESEAHRMKRKEG